MRKPADYRPEADLQTIQTTVAFNKISDAIEQYRRQFGLVFLSLVAFSAVHVGLVVIANLYTQQTTVQRGMLVASSSSNSGPAVPVATAGATQKYDIPYIMSNLPLDQQKDLLSSLKSVNFVDSAGDYRQYTVTGFKLGGLKHTELKLFTSVGHVLQYQRGRGLSVFTDSTCQNSTDAPQPALKTRKLLSQTAAFSWYSDEGYFTNSVSTCVDAEINSFLTVFMNHLSCDQDGCTADSANLATVPEHKLLAILNCMQSDAGTMRGNVNQYMDELASALAHWVDELKSDEKALQYWMENPNNLCVLGAPTFGSIVGPAGVDQVGSGDQVFLKTSCPILHQSMQQYADGFLNGGSFDGASSWLHAVWMGRDNDYLDEDSCAGWAGLAATADCSVDDYLEDEAVVDCLTGFAEINVDFFKALTTATAPGGNTLADYVAEAFDTTDSYADQVLALAQSALGAGGYTITETTEDGGVTSTSVSLSSMLAPFGITVDYSSNTVSTVPTVINPAGLTASQGEQMALAKKLIIALANSVRSLFDEDVKDCVKSNAYNMAVTAVPLVNGMIAQLQTDSFRNWVHENNIKGMRLAAEQMDTQLFRCGVAGSLAWECLMQDRPTSAQSSYPPWDYHYSPKRVCFDIVEEESLIANTECHRLESNYQRRAELEMEGVTSYVSDMNVLGNEETIYGAVGETRGDLEWGTGTGAAYLQAAGVDMGCQGLKGWTGLGADNRPGPSDAAWAGFLAILADKGCTNTHLALEEFDMRTQDWTDVVTALHVRAAMEASASATAVSHSPQEAIAADVNIILHGVFEYIEYAQGEILEDFDNWKATGNYDLGRKVVEKDYFGTGILSAAEAAYSADTYGCTTEPLTLLYDHQTNLQYMAVDACDYNVGSHVHRRPFFGGTMFSMILGAYDGYSMYLPPKFCNADYGTAYQNSYSSKFKMKTFSASERMDYVIMLHGWGGSHTFLYSAAIVLHYAFVGTAPDEVSELSYTACASVSSVANGGDCELMAYPGGFAVLAPDGAAVPLGNRMWWLNSEFTGFVMDYIVFELPNYMIQTLGMEARSFGMFGFSMGAFGTLAAVNAYTGNIAVIYSANAPLYPNNCFFAFTCHQICMTDIIYCELLYTSFGQVLNSYVILWDKTLVVSTGSLDPIGAGIADHMQRMGTLHNQDFVSCTYYRLLHGDSDEIQVNFGIDTSHIHTTSASSALAAHFSGSEVDFLDRVAGDYVASLTSVAGGSPFGGACTYQSWTGSDTCHIDPDHTVHEVGVAFTVPAGGSATATIGTHGGVKTAHASLRGIDTTTGLFNCASEAACSLQPFAYSSSEGEDLFALNRIWHKTAAGQAEGHSVGCFAAACPDLKWCLENNLSAGQDSYLDPIKNIVGSMNFVPTSNMVHDTGVPSAFSHFWHGMPLVKFMAIGNVCQLDGAVCADTQDVTASTYNSYAHHPTLMYIHSAQNDEMGLYEMHIEFVAILLGAMSTPNSEQFIHSETKFVADFGDCDGHFFTLTDMWDVIGWFSDAFHSFVWNPDGTPATSWQQENIQTFEVWLQSTPSQGVALCWIYGHSLGSNFNTGAFVSSPQPTWTVQNGVVTTQGHSQTHFLHTETCVSGSHMQSAVYNKIRSVGSSTLNIFSEDEWHNLEVINEAEMDKVAVLAAATAANDHMSACVSAGFDMKDTIVKSKYSSGLSKMASQYGGFNQIIGLYDPVTGALDVTGLSNLVSDACAM